jgi:hypothetical protein
MHKGESDKISKWGNPLVNSAKGHDGTPKFRGLEKVQKREILRQSQKNQED